MKRTAWLALSFCSAGVVVAGISVLSIYRTTDLSGEAPATVHETSAIPGHAAMRATINPETGEREISAGPPTLALDPETQNALRRDTEGLKRVYHPDGSVSVNLQGRFQSASVARIGENGKVTICTDDSDHVHELADGKPTPRHVVVPEVE